MSEGREESGRKPPETTADRESEDLERGGANGLASGLQPVGTIPGGGRGATQGALGTGGGQTAGRDTGSLKRGGA